jgi:Flp pilus assembly protein TadG
MNLTQRSKERGSATLVEFALILPALLAFIFGIIAFSQAAYTYHFVSNAAREATRYAMVRGTSCKTWATACPATTDDVTTYVLSITPSGINPSGVGVETSWFGSLPTGTACNGTFHPAGCLVNVIVHYTYAFSFPFLSIAPINITSTSQMTISQ